MPRRNNNLTINKKTALPSRNYILSHQQIIIVQATNNKGTTRKLDLYHQETIVLPLPWKCHQERPLVASTSPVTSPSPLSWKNNCFFSIFVSVISIWLFGLILRCDNVFRYISCSITCSNLLGRCPVPFLNRSMSQTKALYISTIGFTYHLDYKVHNKYKKMFN